MLKRGLAPWAGPGLIWALGPFGPRDRATPWATPALGPYGPRAAHGARPRFNKARPRYNKARPRHDKARPRYYKARPRYYKARPNLGSKFGPIFGPRLGLGCKSSGNPG